MAIRNTIPGKGGSYSKLFAYKLIVVQTSAGGIYPLIKGNAFVFQYLHISLKGLFGCLFPGVFLRNFVS
jgi:hypothetical protein